MARASAPPAAAARRSAVRAVLPPRRRRFIALHWITLALVAAAYACIELREAFPRGSDLRETLKTLHYLFGALVLGATAARLKMRWRTFMQLRFTPVRLAHLALYVLLVGLPLSGLLALGLGGEAVRLPGATVIAPHPGLPSAAAGIEDLHEAAGMLGYALIGVHAAAALFHHYVLRDDTLRRMLGIVR